MPHREYAKQSHVNWDCTYHIVVVPKYRKKILFQIIRKDIWEIFKELSRRFDFEIVRWNVTIDHVHLVLRIAPKYSVAEILWKLKGKSAIILHNRYSKRKWLYQKNFWSRWYFVSTVWIDLEMIKKYVENQNSKDKIVDGTQLDLNW